MCLGIYIIAQASPGTGQGRAGPSMRQWRAMDTNDNCLQVTVCMQVKPTVVKQEDIALGSQFPSPLHTTCARRHCTWLKSEPISDANLIR